MTDNEVPLTRREFIQRFLLAGGTLIAAPACGQAAETPPEKGAWQPAYARLEAEGRLAERLQEALKLQERCALCPRRCGVNRQRGELGFCRAPGQAVVHSHQSHFGEETPLVGRHGSGTIFFSHCNLRCVFCQNWPIAHEGRGRPISAAQLADQMLALQRRGCHNINLVTPTHYMPYILQAVRLAVGQGLQIPLVYNTSGYERPEVVALLDGIVDLYLPDLKFMDGEESVRYTGGAQDYPHYARESIAEMHRQVGVLQTDEYGIARRGLMIRHLVMPNRLAGTRDFVAWVAETLPPSTYVNIMAQYRVEHQAFQHPPIARAITAEEFLEALQWAEEAGLTNLDQRSLAQRDRYRRRG